jgi:DNA-binding transcriptional ArsR family regulator
VSCRAPPEANAPDRVGIRDAAFADGALLAGVVADALGVRAAVWTHPPSARSRHGAARWRQRWVTGPKDALYAEFAEFGKAPGEPQEAGTARPARPRPRGVDDPAAAADLGISSCSAHLQTLREAGLAATRRDGNRIYYSLASDGVAGLWHHLRGVAQRHRPHTELARRAYVGP